MVAIMTSAKLASPGLPKIKVMASWFLSMTSSKEFYYVTQIIL